MTSESPVVSVVMATRQRVRFLASALDSIERELQEIPHEVIVLLGASSDGSRELLDTKSQVVHVIGDPTSGSGDRESWGVFMNRGFRAANSPYVCMLSDDCLVVPGAIRRGISRMERDTRIGALAFAWRNWPEDRHFGIGYTFGDCIVVNHGLFRTEALVGVSYCDEDTYRFYHADGDLCLRLRQDGWLVEAEPEAMVEHYAHANLQLRKRNLSSQSTDWSAYCTRWSHLGKPGTNWMRFATDESSGVARAYWGSPHRFLPRTIALRAYRLVRYRTSRRLFG